MEEEQILDTQRLQQQDNVRQVGPLDLWYGGGQHLIFKGALGVESRQTETAGVKSNPQRMVLH